MKEDLTNMIMPDDPLMLDAVEAMRQYHEAKASSSSAEEVERYRVLAASLFQAIADFNLLALGHPAKRQH